MRHVPRRKALWALWTLLALSGAVPAGEPCTIDHRYAPPAAQTLLAVPGTAHQVVVTSDGGLRFADGSGLAVRLRGALAFAREHTPRQRLLEGRLPVVTTTRQHDELRLESTAFVAPSPPTACLRVVLRNRTDRTLRPVLRIRADKAHGPLGGRFAGFQRDAGVFALCQVHAGPARLAAAAKPKRHVFRRRSGRPMPNWGRPRGACDRGFTNIVAGWSGPATFDLKAEPKQRYVVAVGLCESYWRAAGNRIFNLLIEGKKVAVVDPVKKPRRPDVPFVLSFPAADRDGDGWISVTSVATPASPDQNSIINVIWLFDEAAAKELTGGEIVSGRATARAACYVDCGGRADAPGPATLDYDIELPAGGSATLWIKAPLRATKASQAGKLASLDLTKLLEAARRAWAAQLARGVKVESGDAAPADLLYACLVNLLSMRLPEADGRGLQPTAFRSAFSPRAAALGAAALDRMGYHAEAAGVLDNLVARRGDAGLWHEGADAWSATGRALWAIGVHYELTGDRKWLAERFPAVRAAAEMLVASRERTKWIAHDETDPTHGLMPTAPWRDLPADHWLMHDFWAWHGLRAAARAARVLKRPSDYRWLEDALDDYGACLSRSLAASRVLGPAAGCFPAAPGRTYRWTYAACVGALHPSPVPAVGGDERIGATFAYLAKCAPGGLAAGPLGEGGLVDLPLACRYGAARLAVGQSSSALRAFAAVANAAAPTGAMPLEIDLKRRTHAGAMPSAAAAAAYVLLLRDMLVREVADELHLCACAPVGWLTRPLAVASAPTAFGAVSYKAELVANGAKLIVEAEVPSRVRPQAVVVHLPVGSGDVAAVRASTGQAKAHGRAVRVSGWTGKGRVEINLKKAETP